MNHNQGIKDDIDMDENTNLPDDKIKFDDVGEDEYELDNSEEEDNFNGHHR